MSRQYVVQKGDTLWGITQTYTGVGWKYWDLVYLNNLQHANVDRLAVGQLLYIPFDWPWLEDTK